MPKGIYIRTHDAHCPVDCNCGRHTNSGSKECQAGCSCKKHSKPTGGKRSEISRKRMSEARIRYYENHPEARIAVADKMRIRLQDPEIKARLNSNPWPGFGKWTTEQIAKRVATRREKDNFPTALEMSRSLRARGFSSLEIILLELLQEIYPNLSIIPEFSFGKYYIYDFAIPEIQLFCEADGDYWHSSPESIRRDKAKDTYAVNRGWEVQRYSESFLKDWYNGR